MTFTQQFLEETVQIVKKIDTQAVDRLVALLAATRGAGGRLFILGVGGSAGNASHAVNDFRKIAGMEAYAPTDNVSELTARINDDGWDTSFANWLKSNVRCSIPLSIAYASLGVNTIATRLAVRLPARAMNASAFSKTPSG